MKKCQAARSLTTYADQALDQSGILTNSYFVALADGSMTIEAFRKSQAQFYFAVEFFPRPMAALISRIPSARARLDIVRNLVEEHGQFNEQAFHCSTFLRFLQTIGAESDLGTEIRQEAALRAFNGALNNACLYEELEFGLACMGIIEHAFARISTLIGTGVIARQWVQAQALVHYQHHAQLDERHAEEFFAVIEEHWQNPARRCHIEQGVELGLHIFDRLYRELYSMTAADDKTLVVLKNDKGSPARRMSAFVVR